VSWVGTLPLLRVLVLIFPAPLGPTNPNIWPSATVNEVVEGD
jgi:hypothetical protein